MQTKTVRDIITLLLRSESEQGAKGEDDFKISNCRSPAHTPLYTSTKVALCSKEDNYSILLYIEPSECLPEPSFSSL